MSRIGKKAIDIPKDVSIKMENGNILIKGKHGTLEKTILNILTIDHTENQLIIKSNDD
jgi:ribosomal protein L6P/L9E